MIGSEFIANLKEKYGKKISDIEMKELLDLIEPLDDNETQTLYDHLKYNYNYRTFPTIPQIRGYMQALGVPRDRQTFPANLHPQSPYCAITDNINMPCADIVKYCKIIRAAYDAGEEVSGKRLSFMAAWEHMVGVDESDWEPVKRLIIEGNQEELHSFLEAASPKISTDQLFVQRKGRTVSIREVMNQIRRQV